jgi:hypothetical protein
MGYTTSQLITAFRDEFGEDDPNDSVVTDTQVVQFLNQAQREMCLEGNLLLTCATTSTVALQEEYPLPTDYLKIAMVTIDRSGGLQRALKAVPLQDRDATEQSSTNQHRYYIWGVNVASYNRYFIGLQDIPSENGTDDLHIYYRQLPQTMVVAVTDPEVPFQFQDGLIEGALVRTYSRLSTQDSRWIPMYDRKLAHWREWLVRARKYVNPMGFDRPHQISDTGAYTVMDRSIY